MASKFGGEELPKQSKFGGEPVQSSLMDEASRGLGLAVRSVLEGGAALPLAAADLAAYPVNAISRAITGEDVIANYQQTFSKGLSELGFPEPQSPSEQLVSGIGRGMGAVVGGIGAGQLMAGSQSPMVAGVGDILQSAPGVQAISGAGAGGSGELARQAGYGPEGQMLASLAGGLTTGVTAGALAPRGSATTAALPPGARTTGPTGTEVTPQQINVIVESGAQKLGLNFSQLSDDLKDAMKRNAEEALKVGSDLKPDAVARKAVYESLGITPTRALITRSFDDALQEQDLLTAPEGGALRNIYIDNNRAIRTQIQGLADDASAVDAPTFGQRLRAPLTKGERRSQKLANREFNRAMEIEGDIPTQTQPLVNYLQNNAVFLADTVAGRPVITKLKQLGVISENNMVSLEPTPQSPAGGLGFNALPVTLKELSALRQTVNRAWKTSIKQGDDVAEAQLNQMRGILNQAEQDAGSEMYKAYRTLRTKKAGRYEDNPLIDDLLSGKKGYRGTEKIEDSMVFDKAVLNSTAEQFNKVWPRLTPKAKELTRSQVAKHIENKVFSNMGTNEAADVVASAAKLNNVLSQISPVKLKTIFGSEKAARLDRLNTAVREISNPPKGTVPTGSAPKLQALTRSIMSLLGSTARIPLAGDASAAVVGAIEKGAASREAARAATRAIDVIPAQPTPLSGPQALESILSPAIAPTIESQQVR